MNKFIFDVDGTLTPSRGRIDLDFAVWFSKFCDTNDVYLVTGSDRAKTIEQVGEYIYHACKRVYNCNGNDVYEGDLNVRTNKWILPEAPHNWLAEQLTSSDFPKRTGNHFEHRPGMVNFSVVGRNANRLERAHYIKWDKDTGERENIAAWFNSIFPDLEATVGGETGIDIAPRGANKSQILKDFWVDDPIVFFGDACYPNGNDYALSKEVEVRPNSKVHKVTNWLWTWEELRAYTTNRS